MAKGPQAEYTNLLGYFKHLVWLTGIFVTIAVGLSTFLFHSNLKDVREDAKQEATRVATVESKAAVEKAFEDKNINAQIQKAAQEKIGTITDKMIEQQLTSKLQPLQKRILTIGQITESQARMRLGFRSGLDELNAVINSATDPDTLQFARSTLTTTAEDFEESWVEGPQKASGQSWFDVLKAFTNRPQTPGWKSPQNLHEVVELIKSDKHLDVVSLGFLTFRELTGEKVKMFDLRAVNNWCSNHEPKCK
jgi:hypothetical protein